MRADWWDAAEAYLSERLGARVFIDDAVPANVWGYVGDFRLLFGDDEDEGVAGDV